MNYSRAWLAGVLAAVLTSRLLAQQPLPPQGAASPDAAMLALLQQMVAEHPESSDSWRMIGRIYRKQSQFQQAESAFQRALALQPDSAAVHSDLGELLTALGNHAGAAPHFDQVMRLAPESAYAAQLVQRGIRKPAAMPRLAPGLHSMPNAIHGTPRASGEPALSPAGYEIQTFDGADDLSRRLNQVAPLAPDLAPELAAAPPNQLRAFVESGVLYNTNVSLTPISRELTGAAGASFQGFLSPDLEWRAIAQGPWRSGPLLRGYFTVNEGSFSSFDLSSFQPGGFLERDFGTTQAPRIGRVDYVYSLDLLAGDRFGERHSVNTSVTTIRSDGDVVYAYFTASNSNFADDGADPAVQSLDGLTLTTGVSRFFQTGRERTPTWSLGADLEHADTQGADYRYQAVVAHADLTVRLAERWTLVPAGAIGYRDYGDFTGAVARDELTWRAGCKLRWQVRDTLWISAVVGHDRFASDNEDFDTERTEGGLVATWMR